MSIVVIKVYAVEIFVHLSHVPGLAYALENAESFKLQCFPVFLSNTVLTVES